MRRGVMFLDWKAQQEVKADYKMWYWTRIVLYRINELGIENIKRGLREITWNK